ncbi:MAG: hypothetical protein JSS28_05160 [Proteobacteria bacterium]|nr:hypothetical protein [Pseudomonadota bacterium]
MLAHCKKCGHDADVAAITPTLACSACGAIYAKVDAALEAAAKAENAKHAAEQARVEEDAKRAKIVEDARREQEQRNALSRHLCAVCGSLMQPRKVTKGSGGAEFGLWATGIILTLSIVLTHIGLLLLAIALIYSLWRFFGGRIKVCSKCGSPQIYPTDTPRGREELTRRGLLS